MVNKKVLTELMVFETTFAVMVAVITAGLVLTSGKDPLVSLSESLKLTAALGVLLLLVMMFIGIQLWYHRSRHRNPSVLLLNQKGRFQLDHIDVVTYLVSLAAFIILAFLIDSFVI